MTLRDRVTDFKTYYNLQIGEMDIGDSLWTSLASRTLLNIAIHPIDYAKVLIQIGHEPVSPKQTTRFFGKPALGLPNIFEYVSHIKKVDGFSGCYRGLTPKLCANIMYTVSFDHTMRYCNNTYPLVVSKLKRSAVKRKEPWRRSLRKTFPDDQNSDEDEEEDSEEEYVEHLIKNLVSQTVSIILSHPFEVITVRMMAQFVGRETRYTSVIGSVIEIYKVDGISGYFRGLIPKLISNISTLILVTATTYIMNKYVIKEKELKPYVESFISFIASTIHYPFTVVSQCMIVNNCGLAVGKPPIMPAYTNWLDCWSHLSQTNQLKRGSSLLWRYYTGRYINVNGKLVAIPENPIKKIN